MSISRRRVILNGSSLTVDQVIDVSRNLLAVGISSEAISNVRKGREAIQRILRSGKTVYGVNTGYGKLFENKIDSDKLVSLQTNLIRSHAVGTGPRLSDDEARAVMIVRLNSLLRGNSGVRVELVEQFMTYLNEDLVPEIPRHGSLGASGDLAPSAHLALTLIGEGFFVDGDTRIPARNYLRKHDLKPLRLREKEGLAIINGTQVMTGLACLIVHDALNMMDCLDIASSLSLEVLGGNISAFDARVHELRPLPGQVGVAEKVRKLVSGSKLINTGGRTQDPYSLRCIPQVHGAFRDSLRFTSSIVETELNAVTDNPLIFPDDDSVVSAGNFHGQPIAVALDLLGIVMTQACVISERRTDKLLSGFNPKLPLFLSMNPGFNSGLMVTQYTSAALVAQNRVLATPASLDSANVSAGQEDHSSMGVTAALKAGEILQNAMKVVAVELLCACQAVEFLESSKLGKGTKEAYKRVRKISKAVEEDRSLSLELEKLAKYLQGNEFRESVYAAAV